MRRVITFACTGETLVGTLDEASEAAGLLIVSGGNEVRSGAHRGMALLAADIAAAGYPVFRYDRRGVGDSTGDNMGFEVGETDLIAAAAAFRAEAPHVDRLVAFGNCDAASLLALSGRAAGIVRVLLANPWTIDDADDLPPTAAIRARYLARLRSPAAWWRLLSGKVDLGKLRSGLSKLSRNRAQQPGALATRVVEAIAAWGADATVILARGDATAIAYRAVSGSLPSTTIDTDSHSFARAADKVAIREQVLALLRSPTEADR
jgi:exosortase A-associated hydrolase 1